MRNDLFLVLLLVFVVGCSSHPSVEKNMQSSDLFDASSNGTLEQNELWNERFDNFRVTGERIHVDVVNVDGQKPFVRVRFFRKLEPDVPLGAYKQLLTALLVQACAHKEEVQGIEIGIWDHLEAERDKYGREIGTEPGEDVPILRFAYSSETLHKIVPEHFEWENVFEVADLQLSKNHALNHEDDEKPILER